MSTHKNKIVLVTRSKQQAQLFAKKLSSLGFYPLLFPLIEIKPINTNRLIEQFNQLKYHWIIFTSTNAVDYFFKTISPKLISSKIAVVGNKTKMAIEALGLKVDFYPTTYTSKKLAQEIPIKKGELILIPRSEIAKNEVLKYLKTKGAITYPIAIYKNFPIQYPAQEIEKIFNQNIDYITFTSSSIVTAFKKLNIKLNNEKVVSIGPETTKTANALKIDIFKTANPHNIDGMIKVMS